jgi:hypothetical protein
MCAPRYADRGDDGNRLITGGFDRTIIAWDMTPASWASRACALAGRG